MTERTRAAVESTLSDLLRRGEHAQATSLAIRAYGPEILGFLKVRLGDLEHARDVFAWTCEDLFRGLPQFRRQSSVRTFLYAIARNAAYRYADRELRARYLAVPISKVSRESALAVALPEEGSHEDKIAWLRAQLDEDERTLLALRIDKEMSWNEIALVMAFDGKEPDDETIAREASKLRKRFQLLKDKVRKLAEKEETRG